MLLLLSILCTVEQKMKGEIIYDKRKKDEVVQKSKGKT